MVSAAGALKKTSSMMRSGNSDLESYLQWTLCLQKWYINKIALLVEAEQNLCKMKLLIQLPNLC